MSKISAPIYLPVDKYGNEPAILAYSVMQDVVYVLGEGYLGIVAVGFNGDRLKSSVKVDFGLMALCTEPETSWGFSGYRTGAGLMPNLEVDSLASQGFKPTSTIDVPELPLVALEEYVVPWVNYDADNNEVYYWIGTAHISNTGTFAGFVVIDAKTKKYKRQIDLSDRFFNILDVSRPSVSRLRKIFVSNGFHIRSINSNSAVFCIDVQDSPAIWTIFMPDIAGRPVNYVSGTVVDNIQDILYVVCVADSGSDYTAQSMIHAFDIKNGNAYLASSPVYDQPLEMPVLNVEKKILYLVSQTSSNPMAEAVTLLVSLDLKTMTPLNQIELPNDAQISSMIHLTRSGRVGLTTSRDPAPTDTRVPAFFIVDHPEQP